MSRKLGLCPEELYLADIGYFQIDFRQRAQHEELEEALLEKQIRAWITKKIVDMVNQGKGFNKVEEPVSMVLYAYHIPKLAVQPASTQAIQPVVRKAVLAILVPQRDPAIDGGIPDIYTAEEHCRQSLFTLYLFIILLAWPMVFPIQIEL
uniref:Uncharacterized protein n=1 Tax=Romanomermis culicivorax TaxID=13658 RepID=A0A915J914_ROMCU